jgi:hypothetical protein
VIGGKNLNDLAEQVLGKRQRQRLGVEDVGVPEIDQRDLAGQQSRHVLGAPAENPHVKQRVPQIARDVARDSRGQRPRHQHCDSDERQNHNT